MVGNRVVGRGALQRFSKFPGGSDFSHERAVQAIQIAQILPFTRVPQGHRPGVSHAGKESCGEEKASEALSLGKTGDRPLNPDSRE